MLLKPNICTGVERGLMRHNFASPKVAIFQGRKKELRSAVAFTVYDTRTQISWNSVKGLQVDNKDN